MSSNTMEKDVYKAAVDGDFRIFSIKNHEELLKKTHQAKNIIHIAAQHKQINFIKAALNSFPGIPTCESLICDKNSHGNTPLHIAAQVGQEAIIDLLYDFFPTQCTDAGGGDRVFPWRMVNSKGNTPAHVALLYGNVSVAMNLVDKDGSLARVTNYSKETLLHLAIQFHVHDDPEEEATSSSKENVLPIIELLLKIEGSLACWPNADGLTALHLAASLDPVYCIPVIKTILASCPEAAAVEDERSERTILHLLTNHQVASYEQGIELMQIPEVNALINVKDDQGDTPLLLAARNGDSIMVRVLLKFSPKLGLKNKSGVSLRSLHQQLEEMRSTDTPVEYRRKLTEEECKAAKKGNVEFLNEKLESLGVDFLVSLTPREGNILHELMRCDLDEQDVIEKATEFTKQAIQILPSVISQQDRNGNTLLHLILEKFFYHWSWMKSMLEREALHHAKDGLFRLKNDKGDTPLHVAVRNGHYEFAIQLLAVDDEVAGYVNNRNQTPLHLLCLEYGHVSSETLDRLINGLINGNADIAYKQDKDGLTPLLTAVQVRYWDVIKILHKRFPASAEIADFKGRTFWHWFGTRSLEPDAEDSDDDEVYEKSSIYKEWELLINEDDHMRRLMKSRDNDGNTPLHLAIANQQFCFAQFFLRYCQEGYSELLAIENKDGVSSYDLIGSAEHLPRQFEKFLLEDGGLLFGHRSLYGIPTTKIEAYTNTIGVIAALLATITFTAAFTVPGGLDSSNGTPLLLRKAMFQMFMVADVVAMSSSVTVLFCLLWIMTTSKKRESILLLDVSVFLVQTSFYATLATFMAGLYVTTISIVPGIAISTCVICTLLTILLNKRLVMLTIVPFFGTLIAWVPIIIGHPASQRVFVFSMGLDQRYSSVLFWLKQKYRR